jgi:hypothetical protein
LFSGRRKTTTFAAVNFSPPFKTLQEKKRVDDEHDFVKERDGFGEEAFSSQRARWTPNDAAKDCQKCGLPFTWYRWKHHCRMCGL